MKFHVGLLDTSTIIEKMLSHCLHYYVVEMHAFKNWDECLLYTNNESLNILFVDWDMFHGQTRLIDLTREQLSSIPSVLMIRQEAESELAQRDPSQAIPHQIKKPLNPKKVRTIFSNLIPQVTENSIQSFLQHPKSSSALSTQPIPNQTGSPASSGTAPQPNTTNHLALTNSQLTQKKTTPSGEPQKKVAFFLEKTGNYLTETVSQNSTQSPDQKTKTSFSNPNPTKKFDKSNLVLNEDTKNDLAPMAIKSHESKKTSLNSLSEEQILEVLKKYKDSLEFRKLMESTLSDYAKELVKSLLEPEHTKSFIKESMKDFQAGETFKKQVDEELRLQIKDYLTEELPIQVKTVIQKQIKKILSE